MSWKVCRGQLPCDFGDLREFGFYFKCSGKPQVTFRQTLRLSGELITVTSSSSLI